MKPTSWNSIPTVIFRFVPLGKVEKRVLNSIWRYSSIRLFRCLDKHTQNGAMKPTSWNSIPTVIFRFVPLGKVEKRVLNSIWRYSSIRLFRCLEKPTQNGGMKPTSLNLIPRVFYRFPPIGKGEKTRFPRNLSTFVNPAFSAAWKSPRKIVVWNWPRWIRSQGCFFVSPELGKSKQRVFNVIGRPSSTRLFTLLGKAHPNWWYETDLEEFDPKGVFSFRHDGESCETRFELNLTIFVNSAFSLLGKAHPKWWYETDLVEFDPNGVFSFRPDGESRETRFELNLTIFVNSAFSLLGKAHPKWWYETDLVEFYPKRVFSFRPDGQSWETRFEKQFDDIRQFGFFAA